MTGRSVFISHAQADYEAARELVERVEARGFECWFASRDVVPGLALRGEQVVAAIADARVVVIVFSASANSSRGVSRHVACAASRPVRLLPFRVADIRPSGALEFFLAGQQWIDAFPPPMEPHYAKLCDCLGAIIATPPDGRDPLVR